MKKIAAMLVSALVLCNAALPAFAFSWFTKVEEEQEETYQGKVVTIEASEGEYGIENSAGRALTLREGSKLYNGYQVYTEDGYVWVVLDENGVLKMDLDTKIKIEKNGNDLEIILIEGEVFFNITEGFEDDETFTISTSTMTTGIRGTSGIVSTKTRENSITEFEIKLLEGSVELEYLVESAADTHLAELLTSGRTFWLTSDHEDVIEEDYQSHINDLSAGDINGFVAVEIENSTELQEKILAAEGVINEEMIAEIVDGAQDKLAEDEAEREAIYEQYEQDKQDAYDELEALAQTEPEEPEPTAASTTPTVSDDTEAEQEDTPAAESSSSSSSSSATLTEEITITYTYNGAVFATQTITSGTVPTQPYLQPTASGVWCYASNPDHYYFNAALTEDTEFKWILA
ncbi:MAG: FecR family protein [Faecalibacterium sp.]